MKSLSSLLHGLVKSLFSGWTRSSPWPGMESGRESADSMARDARKNDMILRSSGTVNGEGSNSFVSVFSRRGEKGVNQDCCIVWKEFGCQEDMIFCGIFDGHGPWGHFVAKMVRESLPSSLLCNWQETLILSSLGLDLDFMHKKISQFDIWKQSYLRSCATIDKELEQHCGLDSFYSGTTALTFVKQGDLIILANVGDSRAVLATTNDDGILVPTQLTVDFRPNLPQEAERIIQCNGRVFCLHDEPGVHRVWLPDEESPGLAMSRAFGDYCIKNFGIISVPEVTHKSITTRDKFIVLATDGVWDVISNHEAVQIVSSTPERGKAAQRLVEHAVRAWRRKRRGIAVDDCSAICLFFEPSLPS
uniref:protein-serine/threonine phosphatase n=1 Tax=Anthurium amnicola TaxID=1678845 RepID=A0A1D1ZK11_9ARAE